MVPIGEDQIPQYIEQTREIARRFNSQFGIMPNERMGTFKPQLADAVNGFLESIRKRRSELEKNQHYLRKMLDDGRDRVREIGSQTMKEVKEAMKILY